MRPLSLLFSQFQVLQDRLMVFMKLPRGAVFRGPYSVVVLFVTKFAGADSACVKKGHGESSPSMNFFFRQEDYRHLTNAKQ